MRFDEIFSEKESSKKFRQKFLEIYFDDKIQGVVFSFWLFLKKN